MIRDLSLAGHDSELFSFLDPSGIEALEQHPLAYLPLWTFAESRDGKLISVSCWNTTPGCWAFTAPPHLVREDGWSNYRGLTTPNELVKIAAMVLVRHFFVQGYTCALDDVAWIMRPADRQLDRLSFIRGWNGHSTESREWQILKAKYFGWAFDALQGIYQHRREA